MAKRAAAKSTAVKPAAKQAKRRGAGAAAGDGPSAVAALLAGVDHPLKAALLRVCDVIRAAAPGIGEAVKWNAPSFQRPGSDEFFATVHIHGNAKTADHVLLVLHCGAKKSAAAPSRTLADPAGLLTRVTADRGLVRFDDQAAVERHAKPLAALLRAWLAAG